MLTVCIVEERAPYLLLERGNRYAVVERRMARIENGEFALRFRRNARAA
jgi:hypothetical protein